MMRLYYYYQEEHVSVVPPVLKHPNTQNVIASRPSEAIFHLRRQLYAFCRNMRRDRYELDDMRVIMFALCLLVCIQVTPTSS